MIKGFPVVCGDYWPQMCYYYTPNNESWNELPGEMDIYREHAAAVQIDRDQFWIIGNDWIDNLSLIVCKTLFSYFVYNFPQVVVLRVLMVPQNGTTTSQTLVVS